MPIRVPANEWAASLIESLPEGVITFGSDGRILFFNRAAERITGWSAADACGKPVDQVLPVLPGQETVSARVARLTAIPPVNVSNRAGHDITLAISAASLPQAEGDSAETVLPIRDVTTEDAAQRLRSYFLANISHEFRTPLSALKASVELLLEGVDGFTLSETLELVRSIHFSVTSLQTLVDNLLESVSIDAGRFRIRRRRTDVVQLVADAHALMKPLLERRNQELITRIPGNLPSLSVDPMRLTQVLVNLVSNASKYGPVDEPIELTLALQTGVLKVSVADHG